MKVCIGGTFNILHKGHKKLIDKALETAGENGTLFIGITTGKIAEKKEKLKPLQNRIKQVKQYLQQKKQLHKTTVKPIKNKYGPTLNEDFDAIVVSKETQKTAQEINQKRKKQKKKPLKIITIPMILAEDGKPISSTRIKKGKINKEGKLD